MLKAFFSISYLASANSSSDIKPLSSLLCCADNSKLAIESIKDFVELTAKLPTSVIFLILFSLSDISFSFAFSSKLLFIASSLALTHYPFFSIFYGARRRAILNCAAARSQACAAIRRRSARLLPLPPIAWPWRAALDCCAMALKMGGRRWCSSPR